MDIYMQVLRSREDQYNKSFAKTDSCYFTWRTRVTVFHIFVVYTQKQQQQQQEQPNDKDYVCQGFPFDPATGQIPRDSDLPLNLPSPFLLKGRCIPFESDNRDYPFRQLPSATIVSGDNAKDVYRCFVKVTEKINDAKIPYALLAYRLRQQ